MNKKGFSLIEVATAIAIIAIGLVTITSLFISNIKSEIRSKNKLIAIYLANESIEIVRQQRDNNWFSGAAGGWMADFDTHPVEGAIVGLNDNTSINKGWKIVRNNPNEEREKVFLFNNSYVQHEDSKASWAGWGWEKTGFERYLMISAAAAGCPVAAGADCMEVISYVSFNGDQFAKVTTYFYDKWY
jgi:prepilin-type N-terminal cleavage/methylation domain-containing protein